MYRISRREFLMQLGLVTVGGVLVSCAGAGGASRLGDGSGRRLLLRPQAVKLRQVSPGQKH